MTSNNGTWVRDYVNYCLEHQRLTATMVNGLIEQDRRLCAMLSRHARHARHYDRSPDESFATPVLTPGRQSTLDQFLQPTSRRMGEAHIVGQNAPSPNQWTFSGPFTFPESDFFRPVPVRPTPDQIAAATQTCTYGNVTHPLNTTCPITQVEFNPEDTVTQITHCRHLFTPSALNTWFQNNVCCPLCRYDIRSSASPPNNSSISPNASAPHNMPFFSAGAYGTSPPQLNLFSHMQQLFQGGLPGLQSLPRDLSGAAVDVSNGYTVTYSMEGPTNVD